MHPVSRTRPMPSAQRDPEPVSLEPSRDPPKGAKAARLRARLKNAGLWQPNQVAGRRWPMGCVSLEITQRCNLDCTLCYLSEHSEAVRDLPLQEIFRRIDMIYAHYGPGTDVQVSGGEPTLRRQDELVAIVRRIHSLDMRSSLFTNGIKATRERLVELCGAGLTDVAFHVDTTQGRKGYSSEAELNRLREEYLERARGLALGVFFNTTVHDANLHEVAMLASFFAAHADIVRTASFQMQADTGRGVLGARGDAVSMPNVIERLQAGLGARLAFDTFLFGHPRCNRYASALLINGKAYDAFFDPAFAVDFMRRTARIRIDRATKRQSFESLVRAALGSPRLALGAAWWIVRLLWRARRDLLHARGRVEKVSFFLHDFMDACHVEGERLDACVFMAATSEGPMSMCAYNARRDAFLLKPLQFAEGSWDPLAGRSRGVGGNAPAASYPIKWLKGRSRQEALLARAVKTMTQDNS